MPNKYASIIEKFQGRYSDNSLLGPTLDDAHLDKIEAQLGHSLPADYREFLRDYAGIRLKFAAFPYKKNGYLHEGGIDYFDESNEESTLADGYHDAIRDCMIFSAGDDKEVFPGIHLVRDVPDRVMELGWPEEFLPIGSDRGGNQICLALFGRRPGAVFYWRGDIFLVANSFNEFMHLLKLPDDE